MLSISLETLIAVAPLLGEEQESREPIREAQDWDLVARIQHVASTQLSRPRAETPYFCVAPLDILVERTESGVPRFQLAELNGTGIGGLTNMSEPAVEATWRTMAEIPGLLPASDQGSPPVIVIASSGRENRSCPRVNRLYYEKILYADALRRGFEADCAEKADIVGVGQIGNQPDWHPTRPTIVLGHFRELAEAMTCDLEGRLMLAGAPVAATINDRFCLNLAKRFQHQIDLNRWFTANRCFLAGSDKGTAYGLSNRFLASKPASSFPHINRDIPFAQAQTREELIQVVLERVRAGRRVVIKPQATGLGHGIEFFLDAEEPEAAIIERIDRSLAFIDQHYDFQGGGLPYTICEFLDTARVLDPRHELYDHKYELRVVVYRDGDTLRPFPSIAKVSPERYLPGVLDRSMLINNVTAAACQTKQPGRDFVLPLANTKTLEALGIAESTLVELCQYCSGYVGFVLESLVKDKKRAPDSTTAQANASAPILAA